MRFLKVRDQDTLINLDNVNVIQRDGKNIYFGSSSPAGYSLNYDTEKDAMNAFDYLFKIHEKIGNYYIIGPSTAKEK